jgi:hypothetical protein
MKKLIVILLLLPTFVFASTTTKTKAIQCPISPFISMALLKNNPAWVATCLSGVAMTIKVKGIDWEVRPSNPLAQRVCKIFFNPNLFHFGSPYATTKETALLLRVKKNSKQFNQYNCLYVAKHGAWIKLAYKSKKPFTAELNKKGNWQAHKYDVSCYAKDPAHCSIKVAEEKKQ